MIALREVLALFDVKWDSSSLSEGNKQVEAAIGKVRTFAGLIASSAVVMGLKSLVSELQSQGDALGKASAQLGVATDDLQAYRHAANLASVQSEQFDQALRTLQKNQDAASKGGATQAAAFKALGLEIDGARFSAIPLTELLPSIADGLARVESDAERSAIAAALLGDAGQRLLPMFAQGAAGIEAARREIEQLGGGITSEVVKDLEELGDAQTRLNVGLASLKVQLSKGIFPVLTQMAERLAFGLGRLSRFAAAVRETTKQSNIAKGAFAVMGGAGVAKLFTLAGGWSGIGKLIMSATRLLGVFLLRLALPALLIDELITTWQGGDTIISRSIDKLFGEGTTKKVIGFFEFAAGGWDNFKTVLENGAIMLAVIFMGLGGEIAGAFRWAFAAAQDAAGSALNWIIGRVQAVIGKLSEFAAKIPGAKELGADLQKTLEGWKFEGGNVAAATEGIRSERLERVEIFERAQKNISNAMDRSTTNITNNVTVPPGTPASLARRTADATGKATKSSTKRATQAATTNRAP